MPQIVQVPNVGEVTFPDGMAPEVIHAELSKHFGGNSAAPTSPQFQWKRDDVALNQPNGATPGKDVDMMPFFNKPMIPLMKPEPLGDLKGMNPMAAGAAKVTESVGRAVEGLTTPPNVALMAATGGIGKAAQALFTILGLHGWNEQTKRLANITYDPYSEGGKTFTNPGDKAGLVADTTIPAAMTAAPALGLGLEKPIEENLMPATAAARALSGELEKGPMKAPAKIQGTGIDQPFTPPIAPVYTAPDFSPTAPPVKEAKPKADISAKLPRQNVPETPPDPQRELNVLDEIRQKGANTKAKVQAIFPHLSREEAGALVKQAFPNGPEAYALPEKPAVAPEPPKTGPLGLPVVEKPGAEPTPAPPKPAAPPVSEPPKSQIKLVGQNQSSNGKVIPNNDAHTIERHGDFFRENPVGKTVHFYWPEGGESTGIVTGHARPGGLQVDVNGESHFISEKQLKPVEPVKPTTQTPSEVSEVTPKAENPPQPTPKEPSEPSELHPLTKDVVSAMDTSSKRGKSRKEAAATIEGAFKESGETDKDKFVSGVLDGSIDHPEAKEAAKKLLGPKAAGIEDSKPTSIKNAVVDQEREARGLPPAIQPIRKAFGTAWDNMEKKVASDKGYQDRLIQDLKKKPRAVTDEEDAAILHRQVELQNEYGKATKQLADMTDSGNTDGLEDVADKIDALSDQLKDIYDVGKQAGTETARGLAARRMMVNEDFSLAQMELTKRAEKGGAKLTPEERSQITELHEKIQKTQKAYDDYVASSKERISKLEADRAIAEMTKPYHPAVVSAAEKIVKGFENRANAARVRIKERMGRTSAGVDPTVIVDLAHIGAEYLAKGTLEAGRFSAKMVAEFGDWVKPHLDEIYNKSKALVESTTGKSTDAIKRVMKNMNPDEQIAALSSQLKDKMEDGVESAGNQIQKLARAFVSKGITDRDKLVDAVHNIVKEHFPDMERRDTMDAISGYGDFKQLTKDEISVKLRDLKGQLQQVAKLEDMAAGEPPKKTGVERREPSKVEADLIKQVNKAKQEFNIQTVDPETQLKSAVDTIKKRLATMQEDYTERLANKDFAPKERRPIPLDQEGLRLRAEAEKAKNEWRKGREQDRLSKRTTFEKAVDAFGAYRRFNVLTSPAVVPKLAAAAGARAAITPIEEGVGGVLGKIPGIKPIAERAPREGGFSMEAEKAAATSFGKGLKDAWQVLKTGKSDLQRAAGVADTHVELPGKVMRVMELPGRVHAMIKAPVKRAEFERSFTKRAAWNDARGVDVSDPIENLRITREALADADRAIFQDRNRVATWINAAESHFKEKGKPTIGSQVVKLLSSTLLPIKNVPLNIYSEAINYMFGSAIGGGKAIKAHLNGIDTLKPEQADQIMRHLKKGAIGPAATLFGWYTYKTYGGFHERGEKRPAGSLKPGEDKWGDVVIPKNLEHHPLLEDIQAGAEMHRWAEKYTKGEKHGELEGLIAAQIGLFAETPLARDAADAAALMSPNERIKKAKELGKSIFVPNAASYLMDKKK